MPLQLHQRIELFLANRRSRRSLRHSRGSHSRRFGLSDEPPVLRHSDCLPQRQHPHHLPGGFAGISGHTAFPVAGILQLRVILLMKPPRTIRSLLFLLGILLLACNAVLAQQIVDRIVDRIVARVENDIILLSDVRALGRYQLLVDGKSETDAQILDRLIDQWIVQTEADVSHFPHPSDADIDRSLSQLQKSFASIEEYEARKKQSGLNDSEIRRIVGLQLYLSNYLDSRFRPGVQIDPKAIEDFYVNKVLTQAESRGQEPPSLDAARDFIQEALIQQGINEQADRWLKESRVRLHIEKLLEEGAK